MCGKMCVPCVCAHLQGHVSEGCELIAGQDGKATLSNVCHKPALQHRLLQLHGRQLVGVLRVQEGDARPSTWAFLTCTIGTRLSALGVRRRRNNQHDLTATEAFFSCQALTRCPPVERGLRGGGVLFWLFHTK